MILAATMFDSDDYKAIDRLITMLIKLDVVKWDWDYGLLEPWEYVLRWGTVEKQEIILEQL